MWRNDPIVRVEKALEPVITSLLFYYDPDMPNADDAYEKLCEMLDFVITELHDVTQGPLKDIGIVLPPEDSVVIGEFARKIQKFKMNLPQTLKGQARSQFIMDLRDNLAPEISDMIDIFRKTFITTVVGRQIRADEQATKARKMLQKISKQIFYVSISATVEAKRAGESGVVFNYISQEIRRLAQQAESSIEDI